MKSIRETWQRIIQSFPAPTTEQSAESRETRPFFLIVTGVLVFIGVRTAAASPALHPPFNLALFTMLMLLQISLHWCSPRMAIHFGWSLAYFTLQGSLALGITLLAHESGIAIGLFMALIGEAVGMLRDLRSKIFVSTGLAGFALAGVLAVSGGQALPSWVGTALPIAAFTIVYTYLYIRQAEARAAAQALLKQLEDAHRDLAEYAMRVEELTRAAERQRMARELHDTLAQGLAGVVLQLEAVQVHLENGNNKRAQQIIQQSVERARTTLADARRAIDDLRNNQNGVSGLDAAIRAEVERFSSATGIACDLEIALPFLINDVTTEHAVRMVSEGLANITRHARASAARVHIRHTSGELLLEISDNGAGFNPAAVQNQAGHYGLLGMRERARLAGGSLEVKSAPGCGTILAARLPLEAPAAAPSPLKESHP